MNNKPPNQTRPEYIIQGDLRITERADRTLEIADVWHALRRHSKGDWGDLHDLCELANAEAFDHGLDLLSLYHDRHGILFTVVTSADRATTTVSLLFE